MTLQSFSLPSATERLTVSYDGIRRAAEIICHGGVVAFGTETVYGLGALSTSRKAVARIFDIKGRPSFNPLINHFATPDRAFAEVTLDIPLREQALALAERFWPGPLTLVLPRHEGSRICDTASAALPSLALRVPQGRAIQEMLRLIDAPVAAPSANRSGLISPSTASHVLSGLDGKIDAILDTGPSAVGVESTVVDLSGARPLLLRPGGITREALEEICGPVDTQTSDNHQPRSPGQLSSHYAPHLPLRLNADHIKASEALLAFGHIPGALRHSPLIWNLSENEDLAEAAARLFAGLHFLDYEGKRRNLSGIAAMPLPSHGMGLALLDRLRRAAAPRPHQN
ncbi:threonylcarbamoyl-AMP synthase [Saccharibacter sp. 17.LH.SD]|uniref:L-threonylcarbamoyladenylate synthase n=1 Tax=Saccharibacter sp. 17.LH.SD TaxID=2689393 RepID=UPI001370A683|nr:L-threonylcarbamoyladenylate synthase [Saccharibacter sp. 17.LH.SD]MXV44772.1 threonylcarbamoyl-AMP synthase [Saccharibacter sp. 17.LH.SD]